MFTQICNKLKEIAAFIGLKSSEKAINFGDEELRHRFLVEKREQLSKKWGYVNMPWDAIALLNFFDRFSDHQTVTFAELGVARGYTSNRMYEFLRQIGVKKVRYFAIDNLAYANLEQKPPCFEFKEIQFINGDRQALATLDDEVDCVFLDACHCAECVYSDSIAASKIVKKGGYMLFHDTSLSAQYPLSELTKLHQQHYGVNESGRPFSVVEGIITARNEWEGQWRLIMQANDQLPIGGCRGYQKC